MYSPFVSQQFKLLLAQMRKDDLETLAELMQSGYVTPVIDRMYPLSDVPAAIRYSEEGHARGKIVINME
jgi:NADPH:quinone reductase-like Zn-dependent oxidoreductase